MAKRRQIRLSAGREASGFRRDRFFLAAENVILARPKDEEALMSPVVCGAASRARPLNYGCHPRLLQP